MNRKEWNDFFKSNKVLILLILLSSVVLVGSSYAWYTLSITSDKTHTLTAGTLSLELGEQDTTINLVNAVPQTDKEGLKNEAYTFTITNNGTLSSNYAVYLDDVDLTTGNSRMSDSVIKYNLVRNDVSLGTTYLNSLTNTNGSRSLVTGNIDPGATITFKLSMWITEEATVDISGQEFIAKIRLEGNQAVKLCKRATTLHTETCAQTSSTQACSSDGYVAGSKGTTITYGNLGTKGKLSIGDAFDCDVNGDGVYNAEYERFYYMTDMDDDTAVLIYYNNVVGGSLYHPTAFAYDDTQVNNNGPITAAKQLPTINQWKNVSLKNTKRQILSELGTTSTEAGNLPTAFSYDGYAARLLTYQELYNACYYPSTQSIYFSSDCRFILENTKYSNNSNLTGIWLETPAAQTTVHAEYVSGLDKSTGQLHVFDNSDFGVRPVIEVTKSRILY